MCFLSITKVTLSITNKEVTPEYSSPELHLADDVVVGVLERGTGGGRGAVPVPAPVAGVPADQLGPGAHGVGEGLATRGVGRGVSKHGGLQVRQVLVVVAVQRRPLGGRKGNELQFNKVNCSQNCRF